MENKGVMAPSEIDIKRVSENIDEFQVIILYDRQSQNFDYQYLSEFPSLNLNQSIERNNVFPSVPSETFIVWQCSYDENNDLFYKIRKNARREMIVRLIEYIFEKFIIIHEPYLKPIKKKNQTINL